MKNADIIMERARHCSESDRQTTYSATIPQYPVVEEKLLRWVDALCRKKCVLLPSIVLAKAKEIGKSEGLEDKFKASWGWLFNF